MTTVTERREARRYRENWGWMALRGLLAIAFGAIALAWPGMTLMVLVITFGVFVLADGVAELVFAIGGGKTLSGKTWPLVLVGLAGIGAGLAAFLWPGLTALVMLYIISFWAIVRGAFEVAAYVPMRKQVKHAWVLVVSGLLSVAFGLLLIAWPVTGILAVIWMVGVYALITGGLLVGLAFSMRRSEKKGTRVEHGAPPPSEPTPA